VEKNEVNLSLARGAYVEIALHKEVDWSTIKASPNATQVESSNIPRGVLPFQEGGLGPIQSGYSNEECLASDTKESEEDEDSDGIQVQRTPQVVEGFFMHIEVQNENAE